jgi:hypothetical protein
VPTRGARTQIQCWFELAQSSHKVCYSAPQAAQNSQSRRTSSLKLPSIRPRKNERLTQCEQQNNARFTSSPSSSSAAPPPRPNTSLSSLSSPAAPLPLPRGPPWDAATMRSRSRMPAAVSASAAARHTASAAVRSGAVGSGAEGRESSTSSTSKRTCQGRSDGWASE